MACDIVIDAVIGYSNAGNSPDSIVVKGRAQEIPGGLLEIEVENKPANTSQILNIQVTPNHSAMENWTAIFDNPEVACGGRIKVHARSSENPDCCATPYNETLRCETREPEPVHVQTRWDFDCGACNEHNKRPVTVQAILTATANVAVEATLRQQIGAHPDPASDPALVNGSNTASLTLTHQADFVEGDYVFYVDVTTPADCENDALAVTIPKCETTTPPPDPIHVQTHWQINYDNCTSEDKRPASIQVSLTAPGSEAIEATLRQQIGTTADPATDPALENGSGNGSLNLTHSGTFDPGNYTFYIEIATPADCDNAVITMNVPTCEKREVPVEPPPVERPRHCQLFGILWMILLFCFVISIATGTISGTGTAAATAVLFAFMAVFICDCGIKKWSKATALSARAALLVMIILQIMGLTVSVVAPSLILIAFFVGAGYVRWKTGGKF